MCSLWLERFHDARINFPWKEHHFFTGMGLYVIHLLVVTSLCKPNFLSDQHYYKRHPYVWLKYDFEQKYYTHPKFDRSGFELMTSRTWQCISCHWYVCFPDITTLSSLILCVELQLSIAIIIEGFSSIIYSFRNISDIVEINSLKNSPLRTSLFSMNQIFRVLTNYIFPQYVFLDILHLTLYNWHIP